MGKTGELRILKFNRFIKHILPEKIAAAARNYEILNESDLQCICFQAIRGFVQKHDQKKIFRVHSEIYIKDSRIHPDLVVFRKDRPWSLIELKERTQLDADLAEADIKKMFAASKTFASIAPRLKPKRCYFIYLSLLSNPARVATLRKIAREIAPRFVFFVPVIVIGHKDEEALKEWHDRRKVLARYIGKQHASRKKKTT